MSLQKKPDQVNMLLPTVQMQQLSPWHATRTVEVRVDPDPEKGDVYKVESKKDKTGKYVDLYALQKPALMRIANAAGIVWNWRDSGVVQLERDYVRYRAIGAIRLPDGTWQPVMAEKEIDLTVIEEELREKYADVENGERKVRQEMARWRRTKTMRAETGAMLRVIKAALGVKSTYTKEELQKPFLVPRIDFSPDLNDPVVKAALLQRGLSAASSLYGQPPALPAFAQPAVSVPFQHATPIYAPAEEEPNGEALEDETEGVGEAEEADATSIDVDEVIEEDSEPEKEEGEEGEDVNWPSFWAQIRELGYTREEVHRFAGVESFKGWSQAQLNSLLIKLANKLRDEQTKSPTKPLASTANGSPKCAECGKPVTSDKIADYSRKKWGKALCWSCQQKRKAGGAT